MRPVFVPLSSPLDIDNRGKPRPGAEPGRCAKRRAARRSRDRPVRSLPQIQVSGQKPKKPAARKKIRYGRRCQNAAKHGASIASAAPLVGIPMTPLGSVAPQLHPARTTGSRDTGQRRHRHQADHPGSGLSHDDRHRSGRGWRVVRRRAGAPANFSMRGFAFGEVNTLYNGIWTGPSDITARWMDTANLDHVEFLKGPSSLMSGLNAIGGAVNYVTGSRPRDRSAMNSTPRSIRKDRSGRITAPADRPRSRGSTIASTSPARSSTASSTAISAI